MADHMCSKRNVSAPGRAPVRLPDDNYTRYKSLDALRQSGLRLNHFRLVGSHNSYHLPTTLPVPMLSYSHPALDVQLGNYSRGVRQVKCCFLVCFSYTHATFVFPNFIQKVELDVHVGDDTFLVYHVQLVDDHTRSRMPRNPLIYLYFHCLLPQLLLPARVPRADFKLVGCTPRTFSRHGFYGNKGLSPQATLQRKIFCSAGETVGGFQPGFIRV